MNQNKSQSRKIGAHLSAAGGVDKAIERAAAIGCNCVQVFSGSPRVWAKPDLQKIDREKISTISKEKDVSPIYTHALYLVNIASDNAELVKKSLASLAYELTFDSTIGGAGIIVHLGSHQGRGFESVQAQLVTEIDSLLTQTPENSRLLIENAASRNGKIGGDLNEIAFLVEALESKSGWHTKGRLGWCFDTCHGFAAGYYLGTQPVEQGLFKPLPALPTIEKLGLLSSLKLLHVNGSRDAYASNRDRHANFGEGELSIADINAFITNQQLVHLPLVTEVPGLDGNGPDAVNIDKLKHAAGVA